jgi:hypothetical protein
MHDIKDRERSTSGVDPNGGVYNEQYKNTRCASSTEYKVTEKAFVRSQALSGRHRVAFSTAHRRFPALPTDYRRSSPLERGGQQSMNEAATGAPA